MDAVIPRLADFHFPVSGRQYSENSKKHFMDMVAILSTNEGAACFQQELIAAVIHQDPDWAVQRITQARRPCGKEYATNTRISMVRTSLLVLDHLEEHGVISGIGPHKTKLLRLKELYDAEKIVNDSQRKQFTIEDLRARAEKYLQRGTLASVLMQLHLLIPCRDDLWLRPAIGKIVDGKAKVLCFCDGHLASSPTARPPYGPDNDIVFDIGAKKAVVVINKSKTLTPGSGEPRHFLIPDSMYPEIWNSMRDLVTHGSLFAEANYKTVKSALRRMGVDEKYRAIDLIRSAHAYSAKLSGDAARVAEVAHQSMHSVRTSETYLL